VALGFTRPLSHISCETRPTHPANFFRFVREVEDQGFRPNPSAPITTPHFRVAILGRAVRVADRAAGGRSDLPGATRDRQPAGIGTARIRRSIAPNRRRVRWLSARSSQYYRASFTKEPARTAMNA
jgi:hypothetical protein